MKRLWTLLVLAVLVLAACTTDNTPAASAEETLTAFLYHMKRGEYDQANDYVYSEDDLLSEDLKNFDGGNRAFVDQLQGFDYTLSDAAEQEEDATVQVNANHPNLVPVFSVVMTDLTEMIMTDPRIQGLSDEQMMQQVNQMLADETMSRVREGGLETLEKEFPVTLRIDGNDWKVDMENEELVKMLTGNIFSTPSETTEE